MSGMVSAGHVLGVFEEGDTHVGVVEYAVNVAAVGVDLFWGSTDFMQVGVGALFESQGVHEFGLSCRSDRLVAVAALDHETGAVQRVDNSVGDVERQASGPAERVPPGPPEGAIGISGGE